MKKITWFLEKDQFLKKEQISVSLSSIQTGFTAQWAERLRSRREKNLPQILNLNEKKWIKKQQSGGKFCGQMKQHLNSDLSELHHVWADEAFNPPPRTLTQT